MEIIVGCPVDILTPPSFFQLKIVKALETVNLFPLIFITHYQCLLLHLPIN